MKKAKTIRNLVLIFFYLLILTTAFLIYKRNGFEKKEVENEWILFRIEQIQNPRQILWYKNNLLVVKESNIYELDLETKELKDYGVIGEDEILAELEKDLVFIKYANHTIHNPDENATDIAILSMQREEIFSKSFHETIKPLYIKENFLIATDNYLNSPERNYNTDLNTGEIKLFEIVQDYTIQGEETVQIVKGEKVLFNIPKTNDITSFSLNGNLEKIALLDIEGNIWVYFKKSK